MDSIKRIRQHFADSAQLKQESSEVLAPRIADAASLVTECLLANGKVLWECGGLSSNIVASPVAADGMVFAGSSYDKRALLAIRLDGAIRMPPK